MNIHHPLQGDHPLTPRVELRLSNTWFTRFSANRIEIRKPGGTLVVETNAPLEIEDLRRPRIFNLVPGFEAVPLFAEIPADAPLICRIRVLT